MKPREKDPQIKEEFHASWYIIFYKLTFGLIELITGLGITFFGKRILKTFTLQISQELSEDPHDLLAHLSMRVVPHIFTHNTYLILYLIILGSVKIAGAIGLIYKQNWGVDLLVGLTVLMFPFQLINLLIHPSIFDLIYITVGLLIALYLIEFKPKAWISRVLTGRIKLISVK
jgi:uncharacterized membrane protein